MAVAPGAKAGRALESAEAALRDVEIRMSRYLEASELARFNAGEAGEYRLSPELLKVLRSARRLYDQTDGAFDATCTPIVRLWKRAAKAGRAPTEEELARAKRLTGWRHVEILEDGVRKRIGGAGIDLGGIAKGCGIDSAVRAMVEAGAVGGMVNVGGDLRCFGSTGANKSWPVKIRHPFDKARTCATLSVADAAVATSGDYHRYFEVAGVRYSHIVDPRMGSALPAGYAASVTVVSLPAEGIPPSAADADAWATALSVLGPAGLKLIDEKPSLEAMIITGSPKDYKIHMSEGFKALLGKNRDANLFSRSFVTYSNNIKYQYQVPVNTMSNRKYVSVPIFPRTVRPF